MAIMADHDARLRFQLEADRLDGEVQRMLRNVEEAEEAHIWSEDQANRIKAAVIQYREGTKRMLRRIHEMGDES